ncbi:MAG: HAMP domain-containing protein [Nitrospinae bacterium]|nr:HAMP domain-containing protein [Nitrospinota bacterium]
MRLKGIVRGLRGYTIKTKLVLAFIALISIPMLVSTFVASNLITKKLTNISHEKLSVAAQNIKDNLENRTKNQMLEQAAYYAKSEEIVLNIGIGASEQEYRKIFSSVKKMLNIDIVEVFDNKGAVIANDIKKENHQHNHNASAYPELISSAAGGREIASFVWSGDSIDYIAASPIASGDKNIGVFVFGRYMDKKFLESLKSTTGINFFLTNSKGEITLSTFEINKGERIQDSKLTIKGKDGVSLYTGKVNEQLWHLAPIELKDWKGNVLGALYIADSLSALEEDVNRIRYTLMTIALIFLGGVIFMGIITARAIVSPIEGVILMLRNIAEGEADLTKRLDVSTSSTNDEIGQLAKWFNIFVSTIQGIIKKVAEASGNITNTLENISNFSKKVSKGAQEQSISTSNTAASLNQMDASINQTAEYMTELSSMAEEVSASLIEMTSSIEGVSRHAEKAAASVDETSSSIIEMGHSIGEVSNEVESLAALADETATSIGEVITSIKEVEKSAKLSADFSEKASKVAQEGSEAVAQTIEGMDKIKVAVEGSSEVIKKLGSKSKEIGKILNVINEIAEQTTLLALNAAIIAAQAGEHGRGFAVVADEIKNLAERTAVSTKEIDAMIKSVQAETQDAVKAMDVGLSSVLEGVKLSNQAGGALENIAKSSEDVRSIVFQIVKATVEQSKASEHIKESMANVNQRVNRVLKSTHEQAEGGRRIEKAAEEMRNITGQVKKAMLEQSKGSGQISKAVENMAHGVQSVLKNITDQKKESELILKAVNNIESVSVENMDGVTSMDFEVVRLTELAKQLKDEVKRFKA